MNASDRSASTAELDGLPCGRVVDELAERQLQLYRIQSKEIVSHFNHERSVLGAYRGRQLLELMQNADDACEGVSGPNRLLFRLDDEALVVANTGRPFSKAGIESLVISDNSPKRLSRTRCIGNKGLGFRAVLSWTDAPVVFSGDYRIAFSRQRAEEQVRREALSQRDLQLVIDEHAEVDQRVPAPVMRFPFVPDEALPAARLAYDVLSQGFDTIVILPLPIDTSRRAEVVRDIQKQMDRLRVETGIFCYHLKQICLESQSSQRTLRFDRKSLPLDCASPQVLTAQEDGEVPVEWHVHRRHCDLPASLLRDKLAETPEYEIAVAVPQADNEFRDHKLCVYFPTADSIPIRMLLHATVETDDSRKRLLDHRANRFVLRRLARFAVEVARRYTTVSSPNRALELLAGAESSCDELIHLRFRHSVLRFARASYIFPRVNDQICTGFAVRRAPHSVWGELQVGEYFPEMLAKSATEDVDSFLDALELRWFEHADVATRLENLLSCSTPEQAGFIVARLMSAHQIASVPLAKLLVGERGSLLSPEQTVFLPPESGGLTLPNWLANVELMHPAFAESLRATLGAQAMRDVRNILTKAGYKVEEFQVEALARFLVREGQRRQRKFPDEAVTICRDTLGCLRMLLASQKGSPSPLSIAVDVVTSCGHVRAANECYLGRPYPSGTLVHALYAPLGGDDFVADPESLGFGSNVASSDLEDFLIRIGVAREPKISEITDLDAGGLGGFIDHGLSSLCFPNRLFGREVSSLGDLKKQFWGFRVRDLMLPDRLAALLEKGAPEALIAYFTTAGQPLVQSDQAQTAVIAACTDNQRVTRDYPGVPVPNPVLYLLRQRAWIPTEGESRKRGREIILSRAGSRALSGLYFPHGIDLMHPVLAHVSKAAVDWLLVQAGAIQGLESLQSEDLYQLLLELPERDPEGQHAPGVYRALLREGASASQSSLRETFLSTGKLWGSHNGRSQYMEVQKLRYLDGSFVPRALLARVRLFDAPPRQKGRVQSLFGVASLERQDVRLTLDESTTQYADWSDFAWRHIHTALPYLLALRMHQSSDVGRDAARLRRARLDICKTIGLRAAILGEEEKPISIDDEGSGIVLERERLLLVCKETEFPTGDQVFWRAVGDLFADLVRTDVGAEFHSLLACETPRQMSRLLDRLTDKRGEEFLTKAMTVFSSTAGEEEEEEERAHQHLPPPRDARSGPEGGPTEDDAQNQKIAEEGKAPGVPQNPEFRETEPPEHRARGRRTLVVAGRATAPRSPQGRTYMVAESDSLQLIEKFERQEGRFPIRVEHLRGSDAFGCDVVSVASENVYARANETCEIDLNDIVRFIEVKGRSTRSGLIELNGNELTSAQTHRQRFFIYRVFRDRSDPARWEIGILQDPLGSPGMRVRRAVEFDFIRGTGAEWFEAVETTEDAPEGIAESSAPTPES